MKRLWRNYSLSITLAVLFFVAWLGQLVTQWFTWANEQQEHNQPLEVGDFLWQFWTSTLENWQSEFLQLLTFVVLTSFLIHRNSPESKDSDEEMQRSLNRIEKRLKSLEEAGEGGKTKAGSSN
jgi:SNF2 family DNA or RNA helicase